MRFVYLLLLASLQLLSPLEGKAGGVLQKDILVEHGVSASQVKADVQEQSNLFRLPHLTQLPSGGFAGRINYPCRASGLLISCASEISLLAIWGHLPTEHYCKPVRLKLIFPEHYFW